jgi:hypothetical protein
MVHRKTLKFIIFVEDKKQQQHQKHFVSVCHGQRSAVRLQITSASLLCEFCRLRQLPFSS